jgi:hypothetical protein
LARNEWLKPGANHANRHCDISSAPRFSPYRYLAPFRRPIVTCHQSSITDYFSPGNTESADIAGNGKRQRPNVWIPVPNQRRYLMY